MQSLISKFSKNILAGVSVLSQIAVLMILMLFHGVTPQTDHLFIAISVLSVLQLFNLMIFDQFVVFFNRKKAISELIANNFYFTTLLIVFLIGLGVLSLILILIFFIKDINIYDALDQFVEENIISGFILSLAAYNVVALNDRYFNATGEILKSYFLVIIPHLSILLGVVTWTFVGNYEVYIVGYVYAFCIWLGAMLTTYIILKRMKFNFHICFKGMKQFVRNSILMRFGHNIYAFSFQMITNFFLLGMMEGSVTLFNYAHRAVGAIFMVAVGPSNRVYMYELSKLAARGNISDYTLLLPSYLKASIYIYIILTGFVTFILGSVTILDVFYEFNIFELDSNRLLMLFVLVSIWQLIIIFESVYVGVLVSAAEPGRFIFVNTIFAFVYFILVYTSSYFDDVAVIALAGITSQIISYYLYKFYSKEYLYRKEHYHGIS